MTYLAPILAVLTTVFESLGNAFEAETLTFTLDPGFTEPRTFDSVETAVETAIAFLEADEKPIPDALKAFREQKPVVIRKGEISSAEYHSTAPNGCVSGLERLVTTIEIRIDVNGSLEACGYKQIKADGRRGPRWGFFWAAAADELEHWTSALDAAEGAVS